MFVLTVHEGHNIFFLLANVSAVYFEALLGGVMEVFGDEWAGSGWAVVIKHPSLNARGHSATCQAARSRPRSSGASKIGPAQK